MLIKTDKVNYKIYFSLMFPNIDHISDDVDAVVTEGLWYAIQDLYDQWFRELLTEEKYLC